MRSKLMQNGQDVHIQLGKWYLLSHYNIFLMRVNGIHTTQETVMTPYL